MHENKQEIDVGNTLIFQVIGLEPLEKRFIPFPKHSFQCSHRYAPGPIRSMHHRKMEPSPVIVHDGVHDFDMINT